jgi:hypothetical protein
MPGPRAPVPHVRRRPRANLSGPRSPPTTRYRSRQIATVSQAERQTPEMDDPRGHPAPTCGRLLSPRGSRRARAAAGARAGRPERERPRRRPRRSHLRQGGRGAVSRARSRRGSEPTGWERSDGKGWPRWFQIGSQRRAAVCAASLPTAGSRSRLRVGVLVGIAQRRVVVGRDGRGHVSRAAVAAIGARLVSVVLQLLAAFLVIVHVQPLIRRARPSARSPRPGRLYRFAPPMPSRFHGEPAGHRCVDRAACRPGATAW